MVEITGWDLKVEIRVV
jgi:hypothetical protein